MIVHRLIAISAVLAGASQAVGMIVWLVTREIGLYEFDLSALQSADHNPYGYLVPWIGTLTSMVLLVVVGMILRRHGASGGVLLALSMGVFIVNGVMSLIDPGAWRIHAVLARIAFLVLIVAQTGVMWSTGHRIAGVVSVACFAAAIVLYVLPFWFGIDIARQWSGLDMRTFIGMAESLYLAVFYGTMLHATASMSHQRGARGQ